MKVGDLISFKPQGYSDDDYSNPAIVLYQFEQSTAPTIWVVWCEGYECMVVEEDFDIIHLTSSLQSEH